MSEHEERIGKALRSARAGNVEVALHILRPLLREEEIRPHAYLALAYCHEQSGESQKALYLYTCAVSAAPDPVIAAAWKQRLEECRDYVWSQAEHKSPVSPRPRLARSALRMFIACFLLCVGFATFLIPVLVDRLFGVILAEGLILAISSLLGLLAIILLALYVFTQIVRYRHYRYRRECVTPSFETSKENCPACKLQFDGPICPWCRFEKDFENAQRLAAEGNYSGAITSVKMTKDLGDQFYQEKVTSPRRLECKACEFKRGCRV